MQFQEGLFDEDGIWQEDDRAVEGVVLKYYPDLFKSSCPSDFAELLEAIVPKVSTDMNERLTGDFQGIEVHKALKQMYPLKSPGPDNMPLLFFQHFWPTIGSVVTKIVLDFLNLGTIPPKFIETHIVLVTKNKDPKHITNYRPISLCNVIYKLASKVLANRLKKVLPKIISDTQSAFVHGRIITENVLVAFETMHHINSKEGGGGDWRDGFKAGYE